MEVPPDVEQDMARISRYEVVPLHRDRYTHLLVCPPQYLAALDHTQPYYVGGQISIGDVEFAHGGAGFPVSQEALRRMVEHYSAYKKEWETFTDGHWAGDYVLGKAFMDAGVPLTRAWPIFQSDDIGVVPYGRTDVNERRLWCYPTISYHHLSRDTIEELWTFEQEWLARREQV